MYNGPSVALIHHHFLLTRLSRKTLEGEAVSEQLALRSFRGFAAVDFFSAAAWQSRAEQSRAEQAPSFAGSLSVSLSANNFGISIHKPQVVTYDKSINQIQ